MEETHDRLMGMERTLRKVRLQIMVGSMLSIDRRPPLFPSGGMDAYLSFRSASELL